MPSARRNEDPQQLTEGFGDRLRKARINVGMSQRDLERATGIPKSRISRYENGHLLPSLKGLQRLAQSLGVMDSMLLGRPRDPYTTFIDVLVERGVVFGSNREATAEANSFADGWQPHRARRA